LLTLFNLIFFRLFLNLCVTPSPAQGTEQLPFHKIFFSPNFSPKNTKFGTENFSFWEFGNNIKIMNACLLCKNLPLSGKKVATACLLFYFRNARRHCRHYYYRGAEFSGSLSSVDVAGSGCPFRRVQFFVGPGVFCGFC